MPTMKEHSAYVDSTCLTVDHMWRGPLLLLPRCPPRYNQYRSTAQMRPNAKTAHFHFECGAAAAAPAAVRKTPNELVSTLMEHLVFELG